MLRDPTATPATAAPAVKRGRTGWARYSGSEPCRLVRRSAQFWQSGPAEVAAMRRVPHRKPWRVEKRANALHRMRDTRNVFSPLSGDLPVGRFVDRRVESYFCFSEKYFCSQSTQIRSRTLAVPAHRGAFRDRHGRWAWDAVDAAAFCARWDCRASWRKTCERSTASGREMLQRTAKSCGPDAPTLASSSRSRVGPTGLRQDLIRG